MSKAVAARRQRAKTARFDAQMPATPHAAQLFFRVLYARKNMTSIDRPCLTGKKHLFCAGGTLPPADDN